MQVKTPSRPARYLSVAGIAPLLGMKAPALAQAVWRNEATHPVPVPDVIIEPGHGGPDRGWHPDRLPEWEAWRASLPGRGRGGGRPRTEQPLVS